MESRIEELLSKYWEGETSLTEEAELKEYFKENPSLAPIGLYFRSVQKTAEVTSEKKFKHPGRRFNRTNLSIAATITIGILVGAFVFQDSNKQNDFEIEDPEQAYEIARTVLMKMSSNINEAQIHTTQLKKINKAEELIKEEKL